MRQGLLISVFGGGPNPGWHPVLVVVSFTAACDSWPFLGYYETVRNSKLWQQIFSATGIDQ